MITDWMEFARAFAGGLLIGVAAAGYLLLNGRIAGISGLLGSVLINRQDGWMRPRLLFLLGLPLGALLFTALGQQPLVVEPVSSWSALVLGGVLVGFGTRMGGGCTSGHGVCGLSRLSVRSCVAVALFMGAAFLTALLFRHGLG